MCTPSALWRWLRCAHWARIGRALGGLALNCKSLRLGRRLGVWVRVWVRVQERCFVPGRTLTVTSRPVSAPPHLPTSRHSHYPNPSTPLPLNPPHQTPPSHTKGARTLNLPIRDYLKMLKTAGLGSLPGTAAEVRITRKRISKLLNPKPSTPNPVQNPKGPAPLRMTLRVQSAGCWLRLTLRPLAVQATRVSEPGSWTLGFQPLTRRRQPTTEHPSARNTPSQHLNHTPTGNRRSAPHCRRAAGTWWRRPLHPLPRQALHRRMARGRSGGALGRFKNHEHAHVRPPRRRPRRLGDASAAHQGARGALGAHYRVRAAAVCAHAGADFLEGGCQEGTHAAGVRAAACGGAAGAVPLHQPHPSELVRACLYVWRLGRGLVTSGFLLSCCWAVVELDSLSWRGSLMCQEWARGKDVWWISRCSDDTSISISNPTQLTLQTQPPTPHPQGQDGPWAGSGAAGGRLRRYGRQHHEREHY